MKKAFISCMLLTGVACSGPSLSSRPVVTEPAWFVRLDTEADLRQSGAVLYEHPKEWTDDDMRAILGRVLLQERVGLLDPPLPPRAVFSSEEADLLVPALRQAFRMAGPSEWIAFYLSRPGGTVQAITSGALFVKDGYLHVVVANRREPVEAGSSEWEGVRGNPLRSVRGTRGVLTFDPSRYVVDVAANWSGGHSGSASELILDHTAFLASVKPAAPSSTAPSLSPASAPAVRPLSPQSPPPPVQRTEAAAGPAGVGALPKPVRPTQPSDSDTGELSLRDRVSALQDEVERLKRRIEAQDGEIAKLKERIGQLSPAKPR